jgi:hypothetical protein
MWEVNICCWRDIQYQQQSEFVQQSRYRCDNAGNTFIIVDYGIVTSWKVGRRGWGSWPVASVGFCCLCSLLQYACRPISVQWVKWSRFFSVTCRVIVQRGMLLLPWLPPGVWHRSSGTTLALHGGEHPSPFYRTASECRYCKYLSCR